jgi:hypothetical protein
MWLLALALQASHEAPISLPKAVPMEIPRQPSLPVATPDSDPSSGIALAEEALRARLKDPDSAKFTWPYGFRYGTFRLGSKSAEGWITCGTVNAKNSFGGYTGSAATLTVIRDGAVIVALIDIDPRFPLLARRCAKLGMPVL